RKKRRNLSDSLRRRVSRGPPQLLNALSLTPRFQRGVGVRYPVNRFNGFLACQIRITNLLTPDVFAFLLTRLAESHVGDAKTAPPPVKTRRRQTFSLPRPVRRGKRALHEDQLRKCRPCSCSNRPADSSSHRRDAAPLQGRIVPLDQCQQARTV